MTQEHLQQIKERAEYIKGRSPDGPTGELICSQDVPALLAHINQLEVDLAETERDTKRMDWLEKQSDGSSWIISGTGDREFMFSLRNSRQDLSHSPNARSTARAAIDAAMKEETK